MPRYTVNNDTVDDLLSNIKSGTIAIPEMQRPFVWDTSQVRDLMDSLYKGFPVGYIIIWQNPDVKLKDGSIAIGKKFSLMDNSASLPWLPPLSGKKCWTTITNGNGSALHSTRWMRPLRSPTRRISAAANGFPISRPSLYTVLIHFRLSWSIVKE